MSKDINFSAPFILDTIFRDAPSGELERGLERKAEFGVLWEDVISIQSYPYDDKEVWESNQGPKFYLTLREQGTHLCLGEFKKMFNLWKKYRLKYFNYEEDGQNPED